MREIVFVSRHEPTRALVVTAQSLGYSGVCAVGVVFPTPFDEDYVRPAEILESVGVAPGDTVIIVSPGWVIWELLSAGLTVLKTINRPSAREHGGFLLEGLAVLREGEPPRYIPSAVPVEEQEGQ